MVRSFLSWAVISAGLFGTTAALAEDLILAGGLDAYPVEISGVSIESGLSGRITLDPLATANAQRQQLIQTLKSLQDAYCKNAQLDEALAVRQMIRELESQNSVAETLAPLTNSQAATELDSPDLYSLRGQTGKVFYRRVTGQTSGSLWGGDDNVYTDDSSLATAAVHAGVVKPGETAIVRVTLLEGRNDYPGITRGEVTSRPWQSFGGSYRIDGAGREMSTVYELRGQDLAPFAVYVTGSTSGTVYGTDSYTDDSYLGTAAVHAGLLQPGESGFVTVTLEGGRSNYEATTRNGVTSWNYGAWGGGFRLSAYTGPVIEERLKR